MQIPTKEVKAISQKNNHKNLWEIGDNLYCSVCGTCLTIQEQREILKKLKINPQGYEDYEIHGLMVQSCISKNKLSIRLDNCLNKKYHYEIGKYSNLSENEFVRLWDERVETGDICGLYWVAVTKPDLSSETAHKMFCQVHMLSHLNGDSVRKEKAECKRLHDKNNEISRRMNEERRVRKKVEIELKNLEKIKQELEKKINIREKDEDDKAEVIEKQMIERLEFENRELENRSERHKKDADEYLQLVKQLGKEKEDLVTELKIQKELNIQLYREIDLVSKQLNCTEKAHCCNVCEKQNYEGKVLMVGGITKLKGYYRDIVEKKGAKFDYHDGRLFSGEKELEERIKRSDVVFCPVDCNSHGACLSVKKICKKFQKPYYILTNSSLNNVSQALEQLGA